MYYHSITLVYTYLTSVVSHHLVSCLRTRYERLTFRVKTVHESRHWGFDESDTEVKE